MIFWNGSLRRDRNGGCRRWQKKGEAGHTVLKELREKHPVFMQFLLFFIVCNGVTVLQLILMPVLKYIFGMTDLDRIH